MSRTNYPPARTMEQLAELCDAVALELLDDDRMVLILPGKRAVFLYEDCLNELENEKWVDLSVDGQITVTEAGRYHNRRYQNLKSRNRHDLRV